MRLDDNRKITENRLVNLNINFIKNPELFFEYEEALKVYLKQVIMELVSNPEDKGRVEFYLLHREVIKETV